MAWRIFDASPGRPAAGARHAAVAAGMGTLRQSAGHLPARHAAAHMPRTQQEERP
jgi:hypothetical protein